MTQDALGRLLLALHLAFVGCEPASTAGDEAPANAPAHPSTSSVVAAPAFGPDTFPAFAPLADAEQLSLAMYGCPSATRDGCEANELPPRTGVIRLRSAPDSLSDELGVVFVVAVMGSGRDVAHATLSAYFLGRGSENLTPVAVALEGGRTVEYFHYPLRRLTDGWAELASGPWGETAWVRPDSLRGVGGLAFVTPGWWLDYEDETWIVEQAGNDHLVLAPAPDMTDWCQNEDVAPSDSLLRTRTRAELTDSGGHYRFETFEPIC